MEVGFIEAKGCKCVEVPGEYVIAYPRDFKQPVDEADGEQGDVKDPGDQAGTKDDEVKESVDKVQHDGGEL